MLTPVIVIDGIVYCQSSGTAQHAVSGLCTSTYCLQTYSFNVKKCVQCLYIPTVTANVL